MNKGHLKVLNDTKLILDDQWNNLDLFRINLKSFKSFRGPLLLKPVTGQELFFAVSYSKPALRAYCPNIYTGMGMHFIPYISGAMAFKKENNKFDFFIWM